MFYTLSLKNQNKSNVVKLKNCNSINFSFVDGGYWVKLEILNIPWNESLLDFHSEYFDKTKILIETAVGK